MDTPAFLVILFVVFVLPILVGVVLVLLAVNKREVPSVLTVMGIQPVVGAALFTGRIVYESTFLTWQKGLQMVGFIMAHDGAAIAGLLALFLGLLWLIVVVLVAALRRTWMSKLQTFMIVIMALSFGSIWVPYGQWKLLTVKICGVERVTPDWLTFAAAAGEKQLLQHLIANGFDINTRNQGGESLLTIAKRTGHTNISTWLVAHGARELPQGPQLRRSGQAF
jgi:hypothetical protein